MVGAAECPLGAAGVSSAVVVVAGEADDSDDGTEDVEVGAVYDGVLVGLGRGVEEDPCADVLGGELPGAVFDSLGQVGDGAGVGLADGEGLHVRSWMY